EVGWTDDITLPSWTDGQTYEVKAKALDKAGNTFEGTAITFTYDTTPPTVTAKSPTGSDVAVASSITITFSEAMNQTSAQSAFSTSPSVSGSFSWDGNTLTFDPSDNLSYGTEYTVTVAGTAEDLAGNGLDGDKDGTAEGSPTDDYSWSFTTGTAPSTVTLTAEPIQIPADGVSTANITATVKDKDGNPVSDGTEVRFTTDEGSFIDGALTIDKKTTDGIATAELKSILSTETVIATITAEANGSKGATSVFFIEAGGTEVIERKVEITAPGDDAIDARSEADTEVTKRGDGTPTITVAKYESNPGGTIPSGFAATGEYIDVHLDSSEGVDQIEIKNYYTAAQVAGIDESSLRMRWWDGESWVQCSDSNVNTSDVNGYSG
ncbi:unnamed protein product, partial [marine sediment metagenome]